MIPSRTRYSPLRRIVDNITNLLSTPAGIKASASGDETTSLFSRSRRPRDGETDTGGCRISEIDEEEAASLDTSARTSSSFNDESDQDSYPPSYTSTGSDRSTSKRRLDPALCLIAVIGIGWAIGLLLAYPFPTTIPVFVAGLVILAGWTSLTWGRVIRTLVQSRKKEGCSTAFARYSVKLKIGLAISTVVLCYLSSLGLRVPPDQAPKLPTEINGVKQKYFIAANLHNNEAVLAKWSDELVKLLFHLGRENTFVSIYESNSNDNTKTLLSVLNTTLTNLSVPHRVVTEDDGKHWWPYQTSFERIEYLAAARNRALEPIQSPDDGVRLRDWQGFSKLLFLNDIWFNWQSMAQLLDTRVEGEEVPDYDQACAMDFDTAGLYDSWAARDICGTPLRVFWPFVKDPISIDKVRREEPFPVSSCWNGAVALKAGPFLYRKPEPERGSGEPTSLGQGETDTTGRQKMKDLHGGDLHKRGWRMIDNVTYPNSEFSPPLSYPLQFRTSNISACDHSECFLIGYDLHRLSRLDPDPATGSTPAALELELGPESSGPKIYMNPRVKVAYEQNWYRWHNVVLRVPVIKWWLTHWSRGYPLLFVDWIWEHFGRRRDYCTWSALAWHMPDRCPALPGAVDRTWGE